MSKFLEDFDMSKFLKDFGMSEEEFINYVLEKLKTRTLTLKEALSFEPIFGNLEFLGPCGFCGNAVTGLCKRVRSRDGTCSHKWCYYDHRKRAG